MPLAIELAAARVEPLGVEQLLASADRLAPSRQRSLAATVAWSYQLLDEAERRVFRALSVFPGPFTLEAAEAVAGPGAGPAVLHLVDCPLLVARRPGPDGRSRYGMLETLCTCGAERLAEAGEEAGAAVALAGWMLGVAGEAAGGLGTSSGELAAAGRLDAEDATMRQVLAWATGHDPAAALRLAVALAPWWLLRGRAPGDYRFLRELAGRAGPGGEAWCNAQFCLGQMALAMADLIAALGHFTAVCDVIADQGPSLALADCLGGRSVSLANLGRLAEAVDEGHRSLAMAWELGCPDGEASALLGLSIAAWYTGDVDGAVRLARQAGQIPADIRGWSGRTCTSTLASMLTEAGDLADAETSCVEALAPSREAGGLQNQAKLLTHVANLDLRAGRPGDAAAHLREGLQVAVRGGDWFELVNALTCCGLLCAATGRLTETIMAWVASTAISRHTSDVIAETPLGARQREVLREAQQAVSPGQFRAAEERGAAMSLAAAAEYALMLSTRARGSPRRHRASKLSAPGSGSWSRWSRRAAPTRRSPLSCSSASARSARTWTGSGTRPAAAAAPT